jgi:hypothetical protein
MEVLLSNDQLYHEMKLGRAFAGFWESLITFPPTFKYDVGTDRYDTAKGRIPSWTDRILYTSRLDPSPAPVSYRDTMRNVHLERNNNYEETSPGSTGSLRFPTDCDRVKTVVYKSLPQFLNSDHKPVVGLFSICDAAIYDR